MEILEMNKKISAFLICFFFYLLALPLEEQRFLLNLLFLSMFPLVNFVELKMFKKLYLFLFWKYFYGVKNLEAIKKTTACEGGDSTIASH